MKNKDLRAKGRRDRPGSVPNYDRAHGTVRDKAKPLRDSPPTPLMELVCNFLQDNGMKDVSAKIRTTYLKKDNAKEEDDSTEEAFKVGLSLNQIWEEWLQRNPGFKRSPDGAQELSKEKPAKTETQKAEDIDTDDITSSSEEESEDTNESNSESEAGAGAQILKEQEEAAKVPLSESDSSDESQSEASEESDFEPSRKEEPATAKIPGEKAAVSSESSESEDDISSESEDESSDEESKIETDVKTPGKLPRHKSPDTSSDESSSEEESSPDSDEESSDEETKPKADVKAALNPLKRKAPTSSSETSTQEESSNSESESEHEPKAKKPKFEQDSSTSESSEEADSSSDSSSEAGSDTEMKDAPKTNSDSSDSSSSSESEEEEESSSDESSGDEKPATKSKGGASLTNGVKTEEKVGNASESSATLHATSPEFKAESPATNGTAMINGKKKVNEPFSRIPKDVRVDPRFASNQYVSYDYADRAHKDLSVVKGKNFTKEKNKKKRGSYKGGMIDTSGGRSIKFED